MNPKLPSQLAKTQQNTQTMLYNNNLQTRFS